MSLKPIETIYNGHRFRSRLEARWAVFFDEMEIPFVYEPEGYDLNGIWYLPDFWVPCWNSFVEIKPTNPSGDETTKCRLLAEAAEKRVLAFHGQPWDGAYAVDLFYGSPNDNDPEYPQYPVEAAWRLLQCKWCPALWLVSDDVGGTLLGHPNVDPECRACSEKYPRMTGALTAALTAARQARFESSKRTKTGA